MNLNSQALLNRVHRHAEKRGLGDASVSSAEWLVRARKFLALERKILLRNHRQGMPGLAVAWWRATILDVLLVYLLRRATGGDAVPGVAAVALGGFGRGELCPQSDIDLMLLYDDRLEPLALDALRRRVTDAVLYPLWDLKYKVGHSSRTVKECVEEARADGVTRNALMDARFITGARELFDALVVATDAAIREDGIEGQVRFLMSEQAQRHARYGGSVFVQEPDIKNGVGGLRDFHTLSWLARLIGEPNGIEGLAGRRFLTPAEAKAAAGAYSFLLRVRNELHFQAGRATEVLSLEKQPAVAAALGFPGKNWMLQIETLMRAYYQAAETILQTARTVEWRFSAEGRIEAEARHQGKGEGSEDIPFDGFVIRGGRMLSAESLSVFEQNPARLVWVFRHAQQFRLKPDFPLLRLVRENIALLTPKVAQARHTVDCFLAILADAGRVGETVAQMHEAGVLCRFLREFKGIHCLVQREIYHRYTVDMHTLLCLRELDTVFAGATPVVERYRAALLETDEPALLYLVLLLHDIGKQFGVANHAETGAVLAAKILKRMGVRPAACEEVLWLIRGHLEMSAFWQKHDLEDPANIGLFAARVKTVQRLCYLYVLTYCDARATAPELWNDYKNSLHSQLFIATLAWFERNGPETNTREMLRREIIKKGLATKEEVDAHFELLPERYFQQYGAEDVQLHIQMVNQLLFTITSAHGEGALVPVINWAEDSRQSVSVVTIVTWDREGLFYQLAGAFAVAGLNILSGKAIARTDHIAIDTFRVESSAKAGKGGVEAQRKAFAQYVEEALVQQRDLEPAIRKQASTAGASAKDKHLHAPLSPRVAVYQEISLHRTIVEIGTNDRIGLLFLLGRIFFKHRFDITFARITTERGAASDTFYLEPFKGEADKSQEELEALRRTIEEALDESEK
ncbi:MAG: [protein-PII] uridylyltransferase [Puniceicoccales bacterium]|jgi:[protein-PII] uridylyltransferase|nr:[protein-PII] uridylyltransferase [Puniceicoccales bacterium]